MLYFEMPYDLAAERAVIGSVYLSPECYSRISKILSDDDFYSDFNREVWQAEGDCIREGLLDLITLEAKLKERGGLEKIGGMRYVLAAINDTPTSEGVIRYAKQVENCGRRRRILSGLVEACKSLTDAGTDITEISDYVQQTLLIPNNERKTTYTFGEAFAAFEQSYEEQKRRGKDIRGISTGFPVLDYCLSGLVKGRMYVVGGRPGMGKSAFAQCIAYNLARTGKKVAYFSLEMGAEEIVERILAIGGRIRLSDVVQCGLNEKEVKETRKIRDVIENNIIINEEGVQTVQSIMNECIAIKTELEIRGGSLDCIIIDHMQLLSSNLRASDRKTQIGEASRMCKVLAKRLQVPVIVLSQLSRELRNRAVKRPVLTDLRESGEIEQDADVVMFLHRDGYYEETNDITRAEVIIAKQRSGYTGTIYYSWYGEQTRFAERPWDKQKPIEA